MNSDTSGIIYFLANSSMKGLLKIGYTQTSVTKRLRQLNSTGVPTPFKTVAYFRVTNAFEAEKEIHRKLKEFRVSNNREFFRISLKNALELLLPYIIETASNDCTGEIPALNNKSMLSKECIEILLFLMKPELRMEGGIISDIKGFLKIQELVVEMSLANMHEMGIVEVKKQKYYSGYIELWRVTKIKGIKYLYENNLISEDLIQEYELASHTPMRPYTYEYQIQMKKT